MFHLCGVAVDECLLGWVFVLMVGCHWWLSVLCCLCCAVCEELDVI